MFHHGDPEIIDMAFLFSWRNFRFGLRSWRFRAIPSDVDGCYAIESAGYVDFKDTPDAADLPLVVLLERLRAQGWTAGRDVRSAHEARGPLKFDASPGFRHRPLYFQVVLTIRDLFRACVTCVHVRQSDKYYQLVLMHKRGMPPNLPTKSYAALLAGKSLDAVLASPTCISSGVA